MSFAARQGRTRPTVRFVESVVGQRRSLHPGLPQVITLAHKPSRPAYARPGQFAGRLGMEYDPFYLRGDEAEPLDFKVPSLRLQEGMSPERFVERRGLLRAMDDARRRLDFAREVTNYNRQQERAFSLLSSASTASSFNVASEPERIAVS